MADQQVKDIEPLIVSPQSSISKPVYQVTLDGEIIAEYESIGKAEKMTGINRKSIRCVLAGTQKQAGGYIWMHKD